MSSSSESQSGEGSASDHMDQTVPPAPVDLWRKHLEEQRLVAKDIISYFKLATPPLVLLESARNPADLGELQQLTLQATFGALGVVKVQGTNLVT